MTFPAQEIAIPARMPRRRPAWHFVPVFVGFFVEVFALYLFETSTWFRYLLFIFRAWQIAALLPSVMFLLVFATVCLGSLLCGLAVNDSLAARTSLAGLWVAPLLVFFLIRSWVAVVLWILFIIECARLVAFAISLSRDGLPTADKSQASLFAGLPSGHSWNTDSFFSAFFLQGAAWAGICHQIWWAGLALVIATVALVRRSAKMLLDSPTLKPLHAARRVPPVLITVTLLFAFLWLPRGGPRYDGSLQQLADSLLGLYIRPVKAHVPKPYGPSDAMPLVTDVFPGVLLYPTRKSTPR